MGKYKLELFLFILLAAVLGGAAAGWFWRATSKPVSPLFVTEPDPGGPEPAPKPREFNDPRGAELAPMPREAVASG